jgi:hypothetical protein
MQFRIALSADRLPRAGEEPGEQAERREKSTFVVPR